MDLLSHNNKYIVAIQGEGGGGVGQGVKGYISRIVELPRNKNLLRI